MISADLDAVGPASVAVLAGKELLAPAQGCRARLVARAPQVPSPSQSTGDRACVQ